MKHSQPPTPISSLDERREFADFAGKLPDQIIVDDATRERLAQVRANALSTASKTRWLPWVAAASVFFAVSWLVLQPYSAVEQTAELAMMAELEDPNIDLELIDNLEFYEWLSELEG